MTKTTCHFIKDLQYYWCATRTPPFSSNPPQHHNWMLENFCSMAKLKLAICAVYVPLLFKLLEIFQHSAACKHKKMLDMNQDISTTLNNKDT